MGCHSPEETVFIKPSTFNTPLTSDTPTTAKTISKQTILPKTTISAKRSTTSPFKKTFTNGLATNHLWFSLRTPESNITSIPPSTCYLNSKTPVIVECQVRARIPTSRGEFFLHLYRNNRDNKEHLAIVYGNDIRSKSLDAPRPGESEMDRIVRGATLKSGQTHLEDSRRTSPLVRIHSECYTGETIHSARCDCGEQLDEALRLIQSEGRGVVIYLRQEGRGIGLEDKLRAYNLQDLGHDTVTANILLHHPPDLRTYDIATQILADLNLYNIRMLTNNPDKIEQIENGGIKVIERVPMIPSAWKDKHNPDRINNEVDKYLKVK
ncbi:14237_t:CDS:2, partial [Acaulospora morrowiae]